MIKKRVTWTLVLCSLLYYCLTHVVQTRFRVWLVLGIKSIIFVLFLLNPLLRNVLIQIEVTLLGIVTDVSLLLEKATLLIVMTLLGIVTDVSLLLEKARIQIEVTLLGIVTDVSLFRLKASSDI